MCLLVDRSFCSAPLPDRTCRAFQRLFRRKAASPAAADSAAVSVPGRGTGFVANSAPVSAFDCPEPHREWQRSPEREWRRRMLEPVASLSACDTSGVPVIGLNTAFERPRHSLAGHQPDIKAEPQRSACRLNGLQISVREITLNDFAHHLIIEASTPANGPRHLAQTSDQRIKELRRGVTTARNSRKPGTKGLYE